MLKVLQYRNFPASFKVLSLLDFLKQQSELENLEDNGYNATSLENNLLEAEDISIVKCHSTSTKNEKVHNIPHCVRLAEFKNTTKNVTKNLNQLITATKNGLEISHGLKTNNMNTLLLKIGLS